MYSQTCIKRSPLEQRKNVGKWLISKRSVNRKDNTYTVKPVLRGRLWDKEKVSL